MLGAIDAGDAAAVLDPLHAQAEEPLPPPREDDRLPIGLGDRRVVLDLLPQVFLPEGEFGMERLRVRRQDFRDGLRPRDRLDDAADEVRELERERRRELGQVDPLESRLSMARVACC